MQIAYIVGPYRSKDLSTQLTNINKAEQIAKEFWRKGYATICPHMNSKLFDEVAGEEVFIKGYLEILSRLTPRDLVVVLWGYEESFGSLGEVILAETLGIPIMYLDAEGYGTLDN